jgi:hypothetical protein
MPDAQGSVGPEGSSSESDIASDRSAGGVEGRVAVEEVEPVTREIPLFPANTGLGARDQPPTRGTSVGTRTADQEEAVHARVGEAEGRPKADTDESEEVGWLHRSDERG